MGREIISCVVQIPARSRYAGQLKTCAAPRIGAKRSLSPHESKAIKKKSGFLCNEDNMSSKTKKFKKAAKKYLEIQKFRVRPSSYANYSHLLYKRIMPIIGEIKVRDFSKKDLQEFVNASLGSGYSRHSVRDCVSLIKLVLRFSAENGWCDEQIMQITYPKKTEKKKDHFFHR